MLERMDKEREGERGGEREEEREREMKEERVLKRRNREGRNFVLI